MAELKQRVEAILKKAPLSISQTRRAGSNGLRNASEIADLIIEGAIKDLTEQNEKAIVTLKKIAATKNIKMSEFQHKMDNWEVAATALKALGVEG